MAGKHVKTLGTILKTGIPALLTFVLVIGLLAGITGSVSAQDNIDYGNWVVYDGGILGISDAVARNAVNLDGDVSLVLVGANGEKDANGKSKAKITLPSDLGTGVFGSVSTQGDAAVILYSTTDRNKAKADHETVFEMLQKLRFSPDTESINIAVSDGDTHLDISSNDTAFGLVSIEGEAHMFRYVHEAKTWFQAYNESISGQYLIGGFKGYMATVTSEDEAELMLKFYQSKNSSDNGGWIGGVAMYYVPYSVIQEPKDFAEVMSYANAKFTPETYEHIPTINKKERSDYYYIEGTEGAYYTPKINFKDSEYKPYFYWVAGPEAGDEVFDWWNSGEPNNNPDYYDENSIVASYHGNSKFNDYPPNQPIAGYFLEFSVYADGLASDDVTYTSTTIYKVTYNANGADSGTVPLNDSGEPLIQAKFKGKPLYISVNNGDLAKNNGEGFNGWNTNAAGNGDNYDEGQLYNKDENLVLYAKWTNDPATKPMITVDVDSSEGVKLTYGNTSDSISVDATAAADGDYELTYQWYSNTSNSNSDGKGQLIEGATDPEYTPTGLNAGDYYYYCMVTAKKESGSKAAAVSDVIHVEVEPLPVTITANSAEKVYNGSALTADGFTTSDMGSVSHTFTVAMTSGSSITDAGTAANVIDMVDGISVTTGEAVRIGNFLVTAKNGTLTVNPKDVTITAGSKSQTYNGSALTESGFEASELETGDNHTFNVVMSDDSKIINAGTAENVIATVDGAAVIPGTAVQIGNYNVTAVNGTLEVTGIPVTLTAGSKEQTYNGSELKDGSFTSSGLPAGLEHEFNVVMVSDPANADAGTHANVIATVDGVTVTSGTPTLVGNYLVTTTDGTLTVNPKAVTIEAKSAIKAYDGEELTEDGYISTSLETGDEHEFKLEMSTESAQTEAGTHENVITTVDGVAITAGTPTRIGNYIVTTKNGTLTVIPAGKNSVSVQIADWDYNDPANTPVVTAAYGEDTVIITYSDSEDGEYTTDVPTEAGIYYVKATIPATDSYPAAEAVTSFTISPVDSAPAAVTANDRTYDGTEQPLVNVNGDTTGGKLVFAVTKDNTEPTDDSQYSTTIPTATDADTYYVWYKVIGDESGNYNDSPAKSVTVTVEKESINDAEVKLDNNEFPYDGTPHSVNITDITVNGKPLSEDDYEIDPSSVLEAENAGTYTIIIKGKGNFEDTITVEWTIEKKNSDEDPDDLPEEQKPTPTDPEFTGGKVPLVEEPEELPEGYDEVLYSTDGGKTWSTEIPTGTRAGDYPIAVKYTDSDGNKEDLVIEMVVTVEKAEPDKLLSELPENEEGTADVDGPMVSEGTSNYGTFQYSLDGVNWSDSVPVAEEPGEYQVWYKFIPNESDNYQIKVYDPITVVVAGSFIYTADINHVRENGAWGVPEDVLDGQSFIIELTFKKGTKTYVGTCTLKTDELEGKKTECEFKFRGTEDPGELSNDLERKGKVGPASVIGGDEVYDSGTTVLLNEHKYLLSIKDAPSIDSKGKIVVTLIWTDERNIGFGDDVIIVVPLPEDEIGSYKLLDDGTKEYLLFQTYDICIAWLGNEDLCRGYERCYHKEWGDWPVAYEK